MPYGFSGTAIIAKNGDIVLQKAYGQANRASGVANRVETFFDIGSISKTFTAAAILRLEMQGKLSTNDPISKYLEGVPPDKAAITISQVLSHTSGLPRDTGALGIPDGANREEVIQKSLAAALTSAPGQTYSYSNIGFTLLAAVIEKASGTSWQDYLREQLFKPAGLTQATFWSPAMADDARVAVGYAGPVGSSLQSSAPDAAAWGRGLGATGVLTPVGDLYKWWLALQEEGVLSEAARKRMFTAPAVGDEPFGWHIEKRADGSTRIHKGGVVQAFETQFAHYPDAGVVMIFAMNKNISMRAPIWGAIEQVILGKEYALPPLMTALKVSLAEFTGEYQLPTGGKVSAWVDSDRLTLGGVGQDAVNLLAYPDNADPQLHQNTNAATERVVEALKKGELASSKEVPDPAAAQRFWQSGVSRFGAVIAHQVLGTNPRAPGVVQTYVRVEFESSTQVLRFSWSGGKLGPMGSGIPMPGITAFSPQSPDSFASFDYRTSQIVRIGFEKDGAGNVVGLRFLSRDGKEAAAAKKAKVQAPGSAPSSARPAVAQAPDAVGIAEWRDKAKTLKARWVPILEMARIPGVAVAVVAGDEVILIETYGLRDSQKKLPVNEDTLFYKASSTKSFTAMAVVMLAEEGKLDLDAPVKKYLPRFEVADAKATESITLRDLLTHRPGLNEEAITFHEAYSGQINEELFYRLLKRARVHGSFAYSNLHFTLLGRVIQAVTGKRWQEFLTERIFKPAGMKRSVATGKALWGDGNAALFTNPRDWNRKILGHKTDRTMHAAGGTASSIRDLALWLRLNLNGGKIGGRQIIPASVVQKMQQRQVETQARFGPFDRNGYGLGWYTSTYKGRANIHHFGGYEGARAHVSFMPEAGLGVAVVMNTEGAMPEIIAADTYDQLLGLGPPDITDVARQRFAEEKARPPRAEPSGPNPAEPGGITLGVRYAGQYEHPDWGTITVRIDDGKMTLRMGDLETEIFSTGLNKMKIRELATRDAEFILEANRVVALHIRSGEAAPLEFRRKP